MSDCPVSTEVSLTRRNRHSEDRKALPGLETTLPMKTSLTKRFSKSKKNLDLILELQASAGFNLMAAGQLMAWAARLTYHSIWAANKTMSIKHLPACTPCQKIKTNLRRSYTSERLTTQGQHGYKRETF